MHTVVIVGAGFGGLQCARALAHRPVQVVLLDRNNYHLFTPLLYQVASSLLDPSDIAYPVRSVFRRVPNVRFRQAEVVGVDFDRRIVLTAAGPEESYDDLVLATGASINLFDQPDLEHSAYHITTLPNALELRNRVLACFEAAAVERDEEARRRWLTFVIVGAGPTGVEYSGALAELVRLIAGRDYPTIPRDSVRIILLEGGDRVLPPFRASLGHHARRRLEALGVEVRTASLVESVTDRRVVLRDAEVIAARTLVWAAGVKPNTLETGANLPRVRSGRIEVDRYLRVSGVHAVFAIGDAAGSVESGRELPMLSAPAMQQGRRVARNILRELRGDPPVPFRYQDRGIMATIGRHAAVAQVGAVSFRGLAGWIVWLVVHLYFIIGFRNRITVLIGWAWNYVFYDRPIRFVLSAAHRKGNSE